MAKEKPRGPKGVPNRHLHARTTFLYQAATYLTLHATAEPSQAVDPATAQPPESNQAASAHALRLASHLRAVSLKGQVRLSADIKRSMCKTCNAILVPGRTATQALENKSKGAKKPWADVLEVGCRNCGSKKRFPVGATRQQKKSKRNSSNKTKDSTEILQPATPMEQVSTEEKSHSG